MRGKSGEMGSWADHSNAKKNCNKRRENACQKYIWAVGTKKNGDTWLLYALISKPFIQRISRGKNILELFRKTDVIQMYANRIFQIIFWIFGQLLRAKGRMNGGVKVRMEDGTKARGKDVGKCEREKNNSAETRGKLREHGGAAA